MKIILDIVEKSCFCSLVIREHDWVVLKSQVWRWKRVALVDCLEQSCSEEGLENSKDSGRSFFDKRKIEGKFGV